MTHAYWREGGPEFRNVNIMGVTRGMEKPMVMSHKATIDTHLRRLTGTTTAQKGCSGQTQASQEGIGGGFGNSGSDAMYIYLQVVYGSCLVTVGTSCLSIGQRDISTDL